MHSLLLIRDFAFIAILLVYNASLWGPTTWGIQCDCSRSPLWACTMAITCFTLPTHWDHIVYIWSSNHLPRKSSANVHDQSLPPLWDKGHPTWSWCKGTMSSSQANYQWLHLIIIEIQERERGYNWQAAARLQSEHIQVSHSCWLLFDDLTLWDNG